MWSNILAFFEGNVIWGRSGFDRDIQGNNCSRVMSLVIKKTITDNSYMRANCSQQLCLA